MIDLNKTWCYATQENYSMLIKMGVDSQGWSFERHVSHKSCEVFFVENNLLWSNNKSKVSSRQQIQLNQNNKFEYVEEEDENGPKISSSECDVIRSNNNTSNNNDSSLVRINNFAEYGFEGDFEGEIAFEDHKRLLHGYVVVNKDDKSYRFWDKSGKCYYADSSEGSHYLTPIKKAWYEDRENIGKLIINEHGEVRKITDIDGNKVGTHAQNLYKDAIPNWRPLTPEEVMQLVIKE